MSFEERALSFALRGTVEITTEIPVRVVGKKIGFIGCLGFEGTPRSRIREPRRVDKRWIFQTIRRGSRGLRISIANASVELAGIPVGK